jgi:predicted RNA-binding Zn-ribbon protein involved in translation (DUF1610 family)
MSRERGRHDGPHHRRAECGKGPRAWTRGTYRPGTLQRGRRSRPSLHRVRTHHAIPLVRLGRSSFRGSHGDALVPGLHGLLSTRAVHDEAGEGAGTGPFSGFAARLSSGRIGPRRCHNASDDALPAGARGSRVKDPANCPHDGPRDRGEVPLVCSDCGGIEIGRARSTRCKSCGRTFRDHGWSRGEPLWVEAVSFHLDSLEHRRRAPPDPAPRYLELTDESEDSSDPTVSSGSSTRTPTAYRSGPPHGEVCVCAHTVQEPDPMTEPAPPGPPAGWESPSPLPERPQTALRSSASSHSSSSTRPDERPSVPSRARGSRAPVAGSRERLAAWSGAERLPCPGCGTRVRRDNFSRHLKRCVPSPPPPESAARPDE